jgi:hypothetical protein
MAANLASSLVVQLVVPLAAGLEAPWVDRLVVSTATSLAFQWESRSAAKMGKWKVDC